MDTPILDTAGRRAPRPHGSIPRQHRVHARCSEAEAEAEADEIFRSAPGTTSPGDGPG